MTGLEPKADLAVREAVDAYLEGRLAREFAGELIFETKNSRYRLINGLLVLAPDSSLCGAELVGWLLEDGRPSIEAAWRPGGRAVLLDRKRGRHIVVTSTARLHGQQENAAAGSGSIQAGSTVHPPAMPPAPSPHESTPPPASQAAAVAPSSPPALQGRKASPYPPPEEALPASIASTQAIPRPPPIPSRLPFDSSLGRRTGLFHSMPTQARAPSAPNEESLATEARAPAPAALGPLPYPSPPPRRAAIAAEDQALVESQPPALSLARPSTTMVSARPGAHPRARQRGSALR